VADIIVTTPKSRMAEAAREAAEVKAAGGGLYYRNYHGSVRPTVKEGDRVYYSVQGLLSRIYMGATTWTWIKPIPWKAPRSFQYAPADLRDKVEVIGGWLDPKPNAGAAV
jgi:hypothetical protein